MARIAAQLSSVLERSGLRWEERVQLAGGLFVAEALNPHWCAGRTPAEAHALLRAGAPDGSEDGAAVHRDGDGGARIEVSSISLRPDGGLERRTILSPGAPPPRVHAPRAVKPGRVRVCRRSAARGPPGRPAPQGRQEAASRWTVRHRSGSGASARIARLNERAPGGGWRRASLRGG